MIFPNVLYPTDKNGGFSFDESSEIPDFFLDLNLDQVIDAIINRKQE